MPNPEERALKSFKTSQTTHPTLQCHITNNSPNTTVSHLKQLTQHYSVTSQTTHPTLQCHITNNSPNTTVSHHKQLTQHYSVTSQRTQPNTTVSHHKELNPTLQCHITNNSPNTTVLHHKELNPTLQCHIPIPSITANLITLSTTHIVQRRSRWLSMEHWWNDGGNSKVVITKTCPSHTVHHKIPQTGLSFNSGLCNESPVTNHTNQECHT